MVQAAAALVESAENVILPPMQMNNMSISDEEKRQIMNELARGNPKLLNQESSPYLASSDQNFDAKDYQNFDDFAQRPSY
jgi:hypothetical protein